MATDLASRSKLQTRCRPEQDEAKEDFLFRAIMEHAPKEVRDTIMKCLIAPNSDLNQKKLIHRALKIDKKL